MDCIAELIAEITGTPTMSREESGRRTQFLALLFRWFNDPDQERVGMYMAATAEIPIDKLIAAIAFVLRSHRYTKVPTVADLWAAALAAAGMHREQYHAGRYLPPPREWPPPGQRYAICQGELEEIPKTLTRLPAGTLEQLGDGN